MYWRDGPYFVGDTGLSQSIENLGDALRGLNTIDWTPYISQYKHRQQSPAFLYKLAPSLFSSIFIDFYYHLIVDPFAKFPPEVIALILEYCSDFASLDGLLRTSARADQVFRQYYKTITEQITENYPIISQGLQYEFRNFIFLESGYFIPASLPELLDGARMIAVVPLSLPFIHSFDAV
jgi:hypothetical protein